jgi:hypothetical protein
MTEQKYLCFASTLDCTSLALSQQRAVNPQLANRQLNITLYFLEGHVTSSSDKQQHEDRS